MSWLWQNYKPDQVYRAAVAPASPHMEIQGFDADGKCLVNPLPRFRAIFQPLYASEPPGNELPLPLIENIYFHILAREDYWLGIQPELLEKTRLASDIAQGRYGARGQELFSRLHENDRKLFLGFLRRQQAEGSRRLLFLECMRAFFPGSAAYYYRYDDIYLFYIPSRENEYDQYRLALLEEFFWDINCKRVKYYWGEYFGILGDDKSMRIDHVRIY